MAYVALVPEPVTPITSTERREVDAWYDSHLDRAAIERLRPNLITRAIYRIREWRARP